MVQEGVRGEGGHESREPRRRYAVCGVSARALATFIGPLLRQLREKVELVALLDPDRLRFERCFELYPESRGIPCFHPDQLDELLHTVRPDGLIIASTDAFHTPYLLAGFRHNLELICEKPLVTSVEDALKVMRASERSSSPVRVTFNLRYPALHRRIYEVIQSGTLGDIQHVELRWTLDPQHGASYFRRWHRHRNLSGGLLVHKSCHHFDLVRWWLQDEPIEAIGLQLPASYGPQSEWNPDRKDGRFCSSCDDRTRCTFAPEQRLMGENPGGEPLSGDRPLDGYSTYRPDACIFDSSFDAADGYSALLRYRRGAVLSYSIHFASPIESYQLSVTGTRGRLETRRYIAPQRLKFTPPPCVLNVMPLFGAPTQHSIPEILPQHDGGDTLMLEELFDPEPVLTPAQAALYDGIIAVMTGEAVERSIQERRMIRLEELFQEAGSGGAS